jgi:hypothetical protein
MDKGEEIPDKRYIAKVTKKTVDKMNTIGMNAYRIYVRGDGYGVKPSHPLLGKQETDQKKCKKIIFESSTIVDLALKLLPGSGKRRSVISIVVPIGQIHAQNKRPKGIVKSSTKRAGQYFKTNDFEAIITPTAERGLIRRNIFAERSFL